MHIRISIPAQTLELIGDRGELIRRYSVSTAKNGAGEQSGSYCTPRGRHIIRAKIGGNQPANTVFVKRRPTGEVWSPEFAETFPNRDWILTRIMWLSGKQPGFNRLGNVDTMRRYVYLHGSPDTAEMGKPGSIGCVRMRNADIIELFDLVPAYTPVNIVEFSLRAGNWEALGADARPVRDEVFIREQHIPLVDEWDEHDPTSTHIVAYDAKGKPIGTARLIANRQIGRMAVLPSWRKMGVGAALFERALEVAAESEPRELALHAQTQVADFYARYGFKKNGPEFSEAGIPHVLMTRSLA